MTNESPAPVEIPGGTECAACGAKCPAGCYRVGAQGLMGGQFVGAPLCHSCAYERGCGNVTNASLRPGGWPRKQAEVETWHGFAKGERVTFRTLGRDYDGAVDGHYAPSCASSCNDCMLVKRDDGSVYHAKPSSLERLTVSRPPKPASGSAQECGCVPGAAHGCEPAVPERPKLDPYRATMVAQCQHLNADLTLGTCPDCGATAKEARVLRRETEGRMVNHLRWHDEQARLLAGRIAKRDQALAQLSRPLRTGPLRDRDKYGQKVSLKGWDSEDVE